MLIAIFALLGIPDLLVTGRAGLAAIRGPALSAHIRFLADDLLEGRGTGTRGHSVAARYVATQLQALGFEPAGEGGTYFQQVPLLGSFVEPPGSVVDLDGQSLKYGEEVLYRARPGAASDEVRGELVFAGYGITAPEYGYDDIPPDL